LKLQNRRVLKNKNLKINLMRILIPILEIYQNPDGSVEIPDVLRSYMGGQERIENTKYACPPLAGNSKYEIRS
jgi:hypothetical protein